MIKGENATNTDQFWLNNHKDEISSASLFTTGAEDEICLTLSINSVNDRDFSYTPTSCNVSRGFICKKGKYNFVLADIISSICLQNKL